jgi:hypothetical protein
MNQFIVDNTFAIIGLLFLIIFILMGAMIYILYRLLMRNRYQSSQASIDPEVIANSEAKLTHAKHPGKVVEKFHCHNHFDEASVGSCLICEEVFCENCLIEHESMHFCQEHFRVFANNKWKQITDVRTTPDTPEEGLFIYNFKRDMWKERGIPGFVMTHYKINIENDFIESFIQLNVREAEAENLSLELLKYKALD